MKRIFNPAVPYMEAGKCYNYTLNKTENPKQVMKFFVSSVQEHRTIGSNQIYNYSYFITTPNKDSDVCDCGMYIWNMIGDFGHTDYYGVRNATVEEMTKEEASRFVGQLKSKWAREIYLS